MKIINESQRDGWTEETKALSKVCQDAGYELVDALWDGSLLIVKIAPISKYAPEVNVVKQRDGSIEVKANTASFGPLSSTDYEKYVDQARKTYTLLKYLDKFDFDKLEHT